MSLWKILIYRIKGSIWCNSVLSLIIKLTILSRLRNMNIRVNQILSTESSMKSQNRETEKFMEANGREEHQKKLICEVRILASLVGKI